MEGQNTAELVVVGFDNVTEADRALMELARLQKDYLIDLEDAVVAIRQPDGKVNLKQSINLVGIGAASGGLSGALWGSVVGLLFLNPLAGMAVGGLVGAGSGALSGRLVDYGIEDDFIRRIGGDAPAQHLCAVRVSAQGAAREGAQRNVELSRSRDPVLAFA